MTALSKGTLYVELIGNDSIPYVMSTITGRSCKEVAYDGNSNKVYTHCTGMGIFSKTNKLQQNAKHYYS